jgi:hypothetical protein
MTSRISQAIKLIYQGGSILPYYTYHFAEMMPQYQIGASVDLSASETEYIEYFFNPNDFEIIVNKLPSIQNLVEQSLTYISEAANVEFSQSTSPSADIVMSYISKALYDFNQSPPRPAGAIGAPRLSQYQELASDLWFLPSGLSGDVVNITLHELLHTIGLDDVISVPRGRLYGSTEDNNRYTVMSYTPHPGENRQVHELQLYDIAALQALYGRKESFHAGADTYSEFTEIVEGDVVDRMFAIWDSGGEDTIDASSVSAPTLIDLRPGYFSSIGPESDVSILLGSTPSVERDGTLNISIAFGAYIENAVGSGSNDLIIGNLLSNRLKFALSNGTVSRQSDGPAKNSAPRTPTGRILYRENTVYGP